MKVEQFFETWWKPTIFTFSTGLIIFLLGKIDVQPQEIDIPQPFWTSLLGIMISSTLLLVGIIMIGSGIPTGWALLAASSFILAQWPSAGSIIFIIIALACIWTWIKWKERGWFRNFSKS